LKEVHHILVSSVETKRAFNAQGNLHRPTVPLPSGTTLPLFMACPLCSGAS
jgi:hypothetical protein